MNTIKLLIIIAVITAMIIIGATQKVRIASPALASYQNVLPVNEDRIILTVEEIIISKALEYNLKPKDMLSLAMCESTLNPTAKNPISSATGLFQFTEGTFLDGVRWRGLNWTLEDRNDPTKNADMAMWFIARGERGRWSESRHCF